MNTINPASSPNWARLSVVHETAYEYGLDVEQAMHVACLQPLSDVAQTLLHASLSIQPTPAQHHVRVDSHGNHRSHFALLSAHDRLRVLASNEVVVHDRYMHLNATASPTCGEVRSRLAYRSQAPFEPAAEFRHASPYVPELPELRAYAQASLQDGRPLAEAAMELMQRVHADFVYAPASTDISTPILSVYEQRRGVCQDFTHFMIACFRACGLAARYVSGYLLTLPPPGEAPLVGADASHAWLSVWVPGLGCGLAQDWLDLDPTNACIPRLHHVRLAHGRDYGDVTPLRGVIRGGGEHTLSVHVTTRLLEEGCETAEPHHASASMARG